MDIRRNGKAVTTGGFQASCEESARIPAVRTKRLHQYSILIKIYIIFVHFITLWNMVHIPFV
jgi:hypothetical protein